MQKCKLTLFRDEKVSHVRVCGLLIKRGEFLLRASLECTRVPADDLLRSAEHSPDCVRLFCFAEQRVSATPLAATEKMTNFLFLRSLVGGCSLFF